MSLEVIYLSNKKFKATSRGHEIIIDQPKEGKGDDTGMYPIEVFMSAFGACIGLYVNSFARRHEINTDEMKINFDWEYADNPRRVGKINVKVDLPNATNLDEKIKTALIKVANSCTIGGTLEVKPEIKIEI